MTKIPKIIYYTWVSDKPLPEVFQQYLDSWKRVMPDYEVRQISLESVVKSPFVLEAIKRGKYALAGHYGRVFALYETGGLYFDVDIEAVKPFDDLLDEEFFLGLEDDTIVNNAVIGSVAGHPFLKKCMDYMDTIDMDKENIELETGPWMFTNIAFKYEGPLMVFPPRYFYPYSYKESYYPECVTSDTYCIHHWAATWKK